MTVKDSRKSRDKNPKRSTPTSTVTCQTRASCFIVQISRYSCYEHQRQQMDSLRLSLGERKQHEPATAVTIHLATRGTRQRGTAQPTIPQRATKSWYWFSS